MPFNHFEYKMPEEESRYAIKPRGRKYTPWYVFIRWAVWGAVVGLFLGSLLGGWLNGLVPLPIPGLGWRMLICLAIALNFGIVAVCWTWRTALFGLPDEDE
jgi:hypothetical protein